MSPFGMYHVSLSISVIRYDDLCYFYLSISSDDYDLINR
jgi:hypothetical protein